jgi:chromosome segregation ATPase
MTALPHTVDNLCKQEKQKVFDMLKQLSELKKRCAFLEEQLAAKQLDLERVAGREDIMTRQLEATQTKLFESLEAAKDSQIQFEELSLKFQTAESERKSFASRLRESQAESQTLRETIRHYRSSQDHILVGVAVQCRIRSCDKAINTDDSALNLRHAAIQTVPEESKSTHRFRPPSPTKTSRTQGETRSVEGGPRVHFGSELDGDDELEQLITMLNPF